MTTKWTAMNWRIGRTLFGILPPALVVAGLLSGCSADMIRALLGVTPTASPSPGPGSPSSPSNGFDLSMTSNDGCFYSHDGYLDLTSGGRTSSGGQAFFAYTKCDSNALGYSFVRRSRSHDLRVLEQASSPSDGDFDGAPTSAFELSSGDVIQFRYRSGSQTYRGKITIGSLGTSTSPSVSGTFQQF